MDDKTERYEVIRFPKNHIILIDNMELSARKHHVKGLFELDVTEGRKIIRSYKEREGGEISFTAWISKCVAQAVTEHKHVHALRKGRKELIIFDDVDISIPVEKRQKRDTTPYPSIIRKTNEKTVLEMTQEIRTAQGKNIQDEIEVEGLEEKSLTMRLAKYFPSFPKFLRNLVYRQLKNPFFVKKTLGTVMVTSVGMFGQSGGYAIPIAPHPLIITIGGIAKKPGIVNDKIEAREYLSVTISVDHDTVDGAPAARFARRFSELVENAFGLNGLL
ncbi:MAG: 2-oxo acid dehydrogenase subunit E2 [Candidatus Thorarchaeota archaeon]